MSRVIDRELISHLLKLEDDQQNKVLAYMKGLLAQDEVNSRADESEKAIAEGRVKNFEQFDKNFEHWKLQKRINMK